MPGLKGEHMDINKFLLLNDIAVTKNLTMTAERMGYSQSGVSHAIRKIEEETGIIFFTRTNHGVELTKIGNDLLPYIQMISKYYNVFNESIDSINGLHTGSLSIGTYPSIAAQWLPPMLQEYKNKYPNITISVKEGRMIDVEKWIMDGSIDFGFLSWSPDHPFKFITMSRDPLYIITSKDFVLPQAYHGIFPASIFEDYPFIYSESGMDRDDISLFLQKQKSKITKNFTCRDDYTIIKMVERNLGIALLADLVINCHNGNINKFPTYPSAFRTLGIGLLSERNLSLAAKTFIKIAKKIVQEITPDNIL
jgi:transcriptional regulator, lysR family